MQAQGVAQERGQQQIDALHLLMALLSQDESVVLVLLQKLGVDYENLKKKIDLEIARIPVIASPQAFGQFYLTQDMARVMEMTKQEAMKMADEFMSVEHMFLALLDAPSRAKEILDKASFIRPSGGEATIEFGKLDYETALKVLAQIRGGQRITDPEPESKYQVVEKYAREHFDVASIDYSWFTQDQQTPDGVALIGLGVFTSSLTQNQIIAAFLCFILFIFIFIIGAVLEAVFPGQGAEQSIFKYINIWTHTDDFGRGIVDSRPIVYNLSLMLAGLFGWALEPTAE